MDDVQNLALRQSEIRSRLSEIGALTGDALTAEVTTERDGLTTEFRDVESRWRAATIAAGGEPAVTTVATGDPETREREEIRSRCSIAGIRPGRGRRARGGRG